jgi:hypothetical protein
MNKLLIECVWCPSRREFNKFIKSTEKDQTKIVDYLSIRNKLIKSDPYAQEPSNSIIGLSIISEITRYIQNETSGVSRVIYLFKSLDSEVILNFKNLIESKSEKEYSITLTVISDDKVNAGVFNHFDSVKFIKND